MIYHFVGFDALLLFFCPLCVFDKTAQIYLVFLTGI